jgi:putative transposase
MPDHVHLFISVPPYIAPTDIVKTIKSITAIELFKNYSDLKTNKFWGSGLWSKGYYVATAGNVTADTIQRYIDEQKKQSVNRGVPFILAHKGTRFSGTIL